MGCGTTNSVQEHFDCLHISLAHLIIPFSGEIKDAA